MKGPDTEAHPAIWYRRWSSACRTHPGKATLAGLLLIAVLALGFVDTLLARPMRTWAERMVNSNLKGYTVHIVRVRPHLWRLAFELDDVALMQDSHPVPPVGDFGALKFSVVWRELLHLKLAGDLVIERPALHINLAQIQEEAHGRVSIKERGWQKAVESIFPFKLDQVKVQDGSLLYLDSGTASKPLQLTKVFMFAKNVRNMAAAKDTFPSPVRLEGVLFDTGKVWFNGSADFLREPYVAGQGEISLERIPLDRLNPLAQDFQLRTQGGLLSVNGSMQYTPEAQVAHLANVLFENLRVDYKTSKATKVIEREHAKQAIQVAKRVRNAPKLFLRVDTLRMTNSQIGFVNEAGRPPYRLFMQGVNLKLENLNNHSGQGRSRFHAQGVFMGSGTTAVSGGFQSTARPADFDVQLEMRDANLSDLNPFLLSSAGVDVAEGLFSVYTEISVKNGRIEGYIKPLLKNLKVYDKQKDKGKAFGKRVEMHLLQFLASIFKNHTSQEVATVARISGSTNDPKTSEWEAIRRLIGNGFSKAVLPGFLDKPTAMVAPKPSDPPRSETSH